MWTWILRIEEKCEFENVTPAEKLASKIFFVNNNKELKNLSVKVNLGKGAQMIQKEVRRISIQLQDQVAKELKRLIEHDYMQKATESKEDEKEKSVKSALDQKKLRSDNKKKITNVDYRRIGLTNIA